jgi:type IV pilus assembly protein PilB
MTQERIEDFRQYTMGDIAVEAGLINRAQLEEALQKCDPSQRDLGDVLVALGYTTQEKFLKTVSLRQGIPYFTSFEGMLDPAVAALVPEEMARKNLVVPVLKAEDSLTLGMVNPLDTNAIDDIAAYTNLKVLPVLTTLANLFDSVEQIYKDKKLLASLAPPKAASSQGKPVAAEEQTAIDIFNDILAEAVKRRASDIHLECAAELMRVRYRVDGVLHDGPTLDKDMAPTMIARVKILAKLDIAETRLPQDGRFRHESANMQLDLRVSTLPAIHGEKAVLRLLNVGGLVKISELGLSQRDFDAFNTAIRQPNGLVLLTGPTGSGKTSTLYSVLTDLNTPLRNIVTLEDPVEYRIDRINQVEANAKIGLTFASGLRAILRQDPNVILVGEIRDLETAEIAVQAAITGHLVFSTLHTNDAIGAVARLLNMKVGPYLLAPALRAVVAQRLVRRLCEACREEHVPTAAEVATLRQTPEGTFFEGKGCEACSNTGYSGRLALYEVLSISPAVAEMIIRQASSEELRRTARSEGMTSLSEDGLEKARKGLTSLAEVIRITVAE